MEEAGRCRRTDGKRWRCTKAVVPNQKYCDKHMHRGCRRSRKLVESKVAWNVAKSETIKDNNIGFGAKDPKIEKPEDPRGNDRTTKITFKAEEKHDQKVEEDRLKMVTKSNNTQGLEFCPKSVLGQGGGVGFDQSNTQSVAAADDESEEHKRCRRTDGKRWRCTKEVVAGADHNKYCAKHMHRGSKKRLQQEEECNSFALVKRANNLVLGFDSN